MARTVTLLELRTRARELASVQGDPNIEDTELTALANRHLPEVYDALVDAGPPDYYAATTTVTTTPGTTLYALPADFRNLLEVYAQESDAELRLIRPMEPGGRARFQGPTGAWTAILEYIPAPPVLVNDGDTFDGVSGWEELIVNLMARDVMVKRESDPSVVMNTIAMLKARIESRARSRDKGNPKQTVDADAQARIWPWSTSVTCRLACYRLRAGNIELYEPVWGMPW